MVIQLNKDEKFILKTLQKHGKSFICGGKIRDSLLGLDSKDCDFATELPHEKVFEIFKEFEPKLIGESFSVCQVKINGVHFEIARFRGESNHSGNRNDFDVDFDVTEVEDVRRRDLTINGLLFDGDKIIDHVSGLEDLKNKSIKFIGEPVSRVWEDKLRMLRCIRFATRLGFDIDEKSFNIIKENSFMIKEIPSERIQSELNKILLSDNPKRGFELLYDTGLLKHIIPELGECFGFEQQNKHHDKDLANHILTAVENTESELVTRWATLLHDIGKIDTFTIDENNQGRFFGHEKRSAEIAESILKDLKFDSDTIETVCALISNHMNKSQKISSRACKRFMNRVGFENLDKMFDLMRADILAHSKPHNFESLDVLEEKCKSILENNEPTTRFELAINGKDLINTGEFKQGKEIGVILNKLMEIVLENPEMNDREELLKLSLDFTGVENDKTR